MPALLYAWTLTWLLEAVQDSTSTWALVVDQHSPLLYQGYRLNHGPQWLHGPQTSTWPQVVTQAALINVTHVAAKPKDVTKASGGGTDCTCPHGSRVSLWPGAAAWTTNTNMASSGLVGHGDPLRKSIPGNETFLILGLHCCSEPGCSTLGG